MIRGPIGRARAPLLSFAVGIRARWRVDSVSKRGIARKEGGVSTGSREQRCSRILPVQSFLTHDNVSYPPLHEASHLTHVNMGVEEKGLTGLARYVAERNVRIGKL